jgi:hypothetical protein
MNEAVRLRINDKRINNRGLVTEEEWGYVYEDEWLRMYDWGYSNKDVWLRICEWDCETDNKW